MAALRLRKQASYGIRRVRYSFRKGIRKKNRRLGQNLFPYQIFWQTPHGGGGFCYYQPKLKNLSLTRSPARVVAPTLFYISRFVTEVGGFYPCSTSLHILQKNFITGRELRKEKRLAGRLASIKVIFSDNYKKTALHRRANQSVIRRTWFGSMELTLLLAFDTDLAVKTKHGFFVGEKRRTQFFSHTTFQQKSLSGWITTFGKVYGVGASADTKQSSSSLLECKAVDWKSRFWHDRCISSIFGKSQGYTDVWQRAKPANSAGYFLRTGVHKEKKVI